MRVLLLGGYGNFGGRLAQLLSREPIELIIAGRTLAKAKRCAELLAGIARTQVLEFDRDSDVEAQLRTARAHIVVDASGPFQAYGENPYRVVEASIGLGAHYLDLADSAEFVAGISRYDAAAKARGVFALSGVSTFPVLSAAVVRRLAEGMDEVHSVQGGLAPSPHAKLGLSVIRASASYCGKPIELTRDGRPAVAYAGTESVRDTVGTPGCLPLYTRRFSLIDVPDYRLLIRLWPELQSVWFGAAPQPEVLHRAWRWLAWMVRLNLLPSLAPAASLFHWVSLRVRWGEHRSGMFVRVRGGRDGSALVRSWHVTAEGDDGPFIPCMAADAVIRKTLAGMPPSAGARPCLRELELTDYEEQFSTRRIHSGVREDSSTPFDPCLFRRILGSAWNDIASELQALHQCSFARGIATVAGGRHWLANVVARLFRFPRPASDIPIEVQFGREGAKERWRRTFGSHSFQSIQEEGAGRSRYLLRERFGAFAFDMALVPVEGRLHYIVRRWSILGLPMPAALAPRGDSYETTIGGRFSFRVEIVLPLIGLIVSYTGWLVPGPESMTAALGAPQQRRA
jgi:hypothetical protein